MDTPKKEEVKEQQQQDQVPLFRLSMGIPMELQYGTSGYGTPGYHSVPTAPVPPEKKWTMFGSVKL